MALAANHVNIKHSTNLLADIFSSLLWVLLTDQSDGNPSLPADYVWRRRPGQARVLRSCSMPKSGPGNEDLRRRSRVQRRAIAARLALQRSRGHGRIRSAPIEVPPFCESSPFNRPDSGHPETCTRTWR